MYVLYQHICDLSTHDLNVIFLDISLLGWRSIESVSCFSCGSRGTQAASESYIELAQAQQTVCSLIYIHLFVFRHPFFITACAELEIVRKDLEFWPLTSAEVKTKGSLSLLLRGCRGKTLTFTQMSNLENMLFHGERDMNWNQLCEAKEILHKRERVILSH